MRFEKVKSYQETTFYTADTVGLPDINGFLTDEFTFNDDGALIKRMGIFSKDLRRDEYRYSYNNDHTIRTDSVLTWAADTQQLFSRVFYNHKHVIDSM